MAAESRLTLGPYELEVAVDALVEGRGLPLVLISHGTGGSPLSHRHLAMHLARRGHVVALVEHPGNNRSDNSLANTVANLQNRPRHLKIAIDAVLADPVLGPHVDAERIAVIGHSMGGYTALAAAGGEPTWLAHESADGQEHPFTVEHEPRLKALVLLTPATVWFRAEGALSNVHLPVLMLTAGLDEHTTGIHAYVVEQRLPSSSTQLVHKHVAGAGHFSFQSPFPPALSRPDFPPAHDPPGFDRVGYQPELHATIEAFLRDHLG